MVEIICHLLSNLLSCIFSSKSFGLTRFFCQKQIVPFCLPMIFSGLQTHILLFATSATESFENRGLFFVVHVEVCWAPFLCNSRPNFSATRLQFLWESRICFVACFFHFKKEWSFFASLEASKFFKNLCYWFAPEIYIVFLQTCHYFEAFFNPGHVFSKP